MHMCVCKLDPILLCFISSSFCAIVVVPSQPVHTQWQNNPYPSKRSSGRSPDGMGKLERLRKNGKSSFAIGEFEEDERFYSIAREIIIKSEGDPKILGRLTSAIFSSGGATSRIPGETSPKLLRRMEYLKKLKETSDDIKVKRFSEKEIKNTQAEIQGERERDEEIGL